jgi:2-haloacid dehalogenase
VLRDGFALTTAGGYASFRDIADSGLRGLLAQLHGWTGDAAAAAQHILEGFGSLDVHPDVPDGVRRLRAAGYRLATITNGAAALTDQLLTRAGLREHFEALLDVSMPRVEAGGRGVPVCDRHADGRSGRGAAGGGASMGRRRRPPCRAAGCLAAPRHGRLPTVMSAPSLIGADLRDLALLLQPAT